MNAKNANMPLSVAFFDHVSACLQNQASSKLFKIEHKIQSGIELSIKSADIKPCRSAILTRGSQYKTRGPMRRNATLKRMFAFLYNALGIPVAAGVLYPFTGWVLSPMIAALAMSFSSVSVIGNALRLRTARLS